MENKKIKVSVTVPVYNTSKYLRKCLDSLANQSLKDIEVIIVDDGSTDDSGFICDEYCDRYENFRVIHQKNGGLASARQTGLEAARGEYIIVCDSDDWVEPDMYEKLYEAAKNTKADIVLCNYFAEYADGTSVVHRTSFKEYNDIVDNRDLLLTQPGSSWIKLIRKSLFEDSMASYELGINMGEDAFIMYKLMQANPIVIQIKDVLYHYRRIQGENSYTNSLTKKSIDQIYYIYRWLKSNPIYNKDKELIYNKIVNLVFASFRVKDLDDDYIMSLLSEELTWKHIFTNKLTLKSAFVISLKIFPLSLSKKIFNQLYPFVYR